MNDSEGAGHDTRLKEEVPRFDFTFRDVDGNEVSLHDEKFAARSWSCRSAAAGARMGIQFTTPIDRLLAESS